MSELSVMKQSMVYKTMDNKDNALKQHLLKLSAQGKTLIVGGSKSGRTTIEVRDTFDVHPDLSCAEVTPETIVTFERYHKVRLVVDSERITVYAPVDYEETQVSNTLMAMWEQILEIKSIHSAMRNVCSIAKVCAYSPMYVAGDSVLMGIHGDERTRKQSLINVWLYLHRSEYPWFICKPEGFDLILGE